MIVLINFNSNVFFFKNWCDIRSRILAISKDSIYRIQFKENTTVFFSHVTPESELQSTPTHLVEEKEQSSNILTSNEIKNEMSSSKQHLQLPQAPIVAEVTIQLQDEQSNERGTKRLKL